MSTRIKIQVQDSGRFLSSDEPDAWEFNVTRNTRKAAVIAALVSFVKQYDAELEEASRDIYNLIEAFRPLIRNKATDDAEKEAKSSGVQQLQE